MIGLGIVSGAGKTASAPVNLVTNPSFTTNTNDWYGNITRNTTVF